MFRKWMAMMVAMLMLVMVPFGAMAATQHTVKVIPGDMLGAPQAVTDLLNTVALRFISGEESGGMTVLLNETELITLGLTADEEYLYGQTDLLGDAVYCITWEDLIELYVQVMEASMAEAGVMDEALLQELQAAADEMKAALEAVVTDDAEAAAELLTAQTMFPEDPEMNAYLEELVDEMTVEEGTYTNADRDDANRKYRMTMDAEDLKPLMDSDYMRTLLKETLVSQMPEATDAELEAALDEMVVEVKALLEEVSFEMILEAYTQGDDETLVGVDFIMNMSFEGEGNVMQMAGVYNRLTDDDGVFHEVDFAVAVEGETVKFAFELDAANDGSFEGLLGALIDGEEYVIAYEGEEEGEQNTLSFALYLRSGATAILSPAASARPLISLVIVSEPAADEVLAALENVSPADAVNVMTMTEAQLNALNSTLSSNGMQLYITLLTEMPDSVMQMLMQQM